MEDIWRGGRISDEKVTSYTKNYSKHNPKPIVNDESFNDYYKILLLIRLKLYLLDGDQNVVYIPEMIKLRKYKKKIQF